MYLTRTQDHGHIGNHHRGHRLTAQRQQCKESAKPKQQSLGPHARKERTADAVGFYDGLGFRVRVL